MIISKTTPLDTFFVVVKIKHKTILIQLKHPTFSRQHDFKKTTLATSLIYSPIFFLFVNFKMFFYRFSNTLAIARNGASRLETLTF